MPKWIKSIFCSGFALLFCFLCVGYAALNDELSITGTVSATPKTVEGGNRILPRSFTETFSMENYKAYTEKMQEEYPSVYAAMWAEIEQNAVKVTTDDYTKTGLMLTIQAKYIRSLYPNADLPPYGGVLLHQAALVANTSTVIFGTWSEYSRDVTGYAQIPADEANSGGVMLCYPYNIGSKSGCTVYILVDDSKYSSILAPTDCSQLFLQCQYLKKIQFNGILDTSNVTNMSQMFGGCAQLTELDLSTFQTAKVTNMSEMFSNCVSLETIYASDEFVTTKVKNGTNMFSGCYKLVGEKNTTVLGNSYLYGDSAFTHTYARIDKPGKPGYFTGDASTLELEGASGYALPRPDTAVTVKEPPAPTLRVMYTENLTVTLTDDGIEETTTLSVIPDSGYALSDIFTVSFGGSRYVIYTKPEHGGSNPQGMGFDALTNTLTISNSLLPSGAFELVFTGVATARYR